MAWSRAVCFTLAFLCGIFAAQSLNNARVAANVTSRPTRATVVELFAVVMWLGLGAAIAIAGAS